MQAQEQWKENLMKILSPEVGLQEWEMGSKENGKIYTYIAVPLGIVCIYCLWFCISHTECNNEVWVGESWVV